MAQPQVIEGTSEEIISILLAGAYSGQKLQVYIEPDEEFDGKSNRLVHTEEVTGSNPVLPMFSNHCCDILRLE